MRVRIHAVQILQPEGVPVGAELRHYAPEEEPEGREAISEGHGLRI